MKGSPAAPTGPAVRKAPHKLAQSAASQILLATLTAKTLSSYLIKVARLGGYLARTRDPPPGNTVMWRGLSRLTDIALGARLANPSRQCG